MGRTESPHLKNDYERACGWYGHFNKSEMALFSECTDRYAQKLLDTADIVREAIYHQLMLPNSPALSLARIEADRIRSSSVVFGSRFCHWLGTSCFSERLADSIIA